MKLQEAKQAIRTFIATWPTQRVAEVYAFNADGKMSFNDACGCIRGVSMCETLHNRTAFRVAGGPDHCPETPNREGAIHHYDLNNSDLAIWAEWAYRYLGEIPANRKDMVSTHGTIGDYWRKIRLSPILRAELRRRLRVEAGWQPRTELAEVGNGV